MKIYQFFTYLALFGTAVLAGPHFQSEPTRKIDDSGALVVTFDEAGLGNTVPSIDYTLSADVSALFGCFNKGGNHPQASNKETVSTTITTLDTFPVKNGRVRDSISSGPPSSGTFSCPRGQTLRLAEVSYTEIVLTDTTNDITAPVPDVSRVFIPGV
ncbi:hypothetical protein V491_06775 [Pseudogymnoascus sp. VKM F-3775]|nr:hypothetical protein V491_06775 [Pseudogymnoascus sp. VKM F-3775]